MKAWLDNENVLLLRSPPGSGKTTFAFSFAAHLHSKGFKATYLNASLSQSAVDDTRPMDDVWRNAFESDSTFSDMCTTPSEEDHYIIIDETQSWYPPNVKGWSAQQELHRFWADVKFFIILPQI
jgi:tRNA uridine 5-carbamoylmethylation protein Kti12